MPYQLEFLPHCLLDLPPNGWRYAPSGYWWMGRDNATLTEPALSQRNCLKTRRVPPVRCTSVGWGHPISPKKQGRKRSILPMADEKPYISSGEPKSSRGAPGLPVELIYQLVTPGAIPIRKLYHCSDRVCHSTNDES